MACRSAPGEIAGCSPKELKKFDKAGRRFGTGQDSHLLTQALGVYGYHLVRAVDIAGKGVRQLEESDRDNFASNCIKAFSREGRFLRHAFRRLAGDHIDLCFSSREGNHLLRWSPWRSDLVDDFVDRRARRMA